MHVCSRFRVVYFFFASIHSPGHHVVEQHSPRVFYLSYFSLDSFILLLYSAGNTITEADQSLQSTKKRVDVPTAVLRGDCTF